jgi:GGDEF domain-containing protein
MHPVAAAFWGGFFTVAAFMLVAAIAAAAKGVRRVAAVGMTFSLLPALFICSYLGLLPIDHGAAQRFLAHLNVLGAFALTSQLLLVLRGYRKPMADRPLQLGMLLAGLAVLAVSWVMPPAAGFSLSYIYANALGLWLIAIALMKALRGNRVAWISAGAVSLALVSLGCVAWIFERGGAAPIALHAVAAVSSLSYIAIMGWTLWMRYAYALELKQVLAQGPSFDPVTRLPSHAHAGRLVGSFLRSGSAQPLGVVAVSLANLASLESLNGRAAYNHALYVSAGRLRRTAPMGAQLGRLGDDGFLVLLRTTDPELLKQVASKVRRALTQPIHVGADMDANEGDAVPTEWVADVGVGVTLSKEPDAAGSAVATARAMSRAALAATGRIVYSEGRDGPFHEVPATST